METSSVFETEFAKFQFTTDGGFLHSFECIYGIEIHSLARRASVLDSLGGIVLNCQQQAYVPKKSNKVRLSAHG